MDKEEAILTLKKNKLDMEHDALLQDRSAIVITEAGLPITIINLIIAAQLYDPTSLVLIAITVAMIVSIIELLRQRNSREIKNKHHEIDVLVRQFQTQSPD
jgi:hypothetical protein